MYRIKLLNVGTPIIMKRNGLSFNTGIIKLNSEVSSGLKERKPVVALESTIITHGMPYPYNLNTALEVEGIIRRNGAIPATVAVLCGTVHVGLEEPLLKCLAQEKDTIKISRRDLSVAIAKKYSGGTTVSATMLVAHKLGIRVFVTGGIGGVHREGNESMDISSDLTELGRTPIAVVSSGVKSILDIEKTLQYLETQGVCVLSYGTSKRFPSFFSVNSGFEAPHNVETPQAAADVISKWCEFGGDSGILLAVPPSEDEAVDGAVVEAAIKDAVEEAR